MAQTNQLQGVGIVQSRKMKQQKMTLHDKTVKSKQYNNTYTQCRFTQ